MSPKQPRKKPIGKSKPPAKKPNEVAKRREAILSAIKQNPGISDAELARRLGIEQRQLRENLRALISTTEGIKALRARSSYLKSEAEIKKMEVKRAIAKLIYSGVKNQKQIAKELGISTDQLRKILNEMQNGSFEEQNLVNKLKRSTRRPPSVVVTTQKDPRKKKLDEAYQKKFEEYSNKSTPEIQQEIARLSKEIKTKQGEERDLMQMEINALKWILGRRTL
ncbi:MAG: transposase [Candidatus Diapherotrites archaeon]